MLEEYLQDMEDQNMTPDLIVLNNQDFCELALECGVSVHESVFECDNLIIVRSTQLVSHSPVAYERML